MSARPYGRSLHIGVNAVDPCHYARYPGILQGAENDALSMEEIAKTQGFEHKNLLGENARADAVLREILDAAYTLPKGSYYLLTFAGHGVQSKNDGQEPADNELYDQNWCLYDRMLIDDELRRRCWPEFAEAVRVVVVIDACHSVSSPYYQVRNGVRALKGFDFRQFCRRTRALPKRFVARTILEHAQLYQNILDNLPEHKDPKALVGSMAACEDDEDAFDGPHGAFTQALLDEWNDGHFTGTHGELMKKVRKVVKARYPSQSPATCCEGRDAIFNAKAFQI